jgi:hypothetical protein
MNSPINVATLIVFKLICISGQVRIEFQVEKETNFIVFHSKNLTITEKVSIVFMYYHLSISNRKCDHVLDHYL